MQRATIRSSVKAIMAAALLCAGGPWDQTTVCGRGECEILNHR